MTTSAYSEVLKQASVNSLTLNWCYKRNSVLTTIIINDSENSPARGASEAQILLHLSILAQSAALDLKGD